MDVAGPAAAGRGSTSPTDDHGRASAGLALPFMTVVIGRVWRSKPGVINKGPAAVVAAS
jgi:hypothetical protein